MRRPWQMGMKVAFGLKAHSGWAALVVVGKAAGGVAIVDRRRMELVDEVWAKAPYHAAEDLQPAAARDLVRRGVESAHRIAIREIRAAVEQERERGHDVTACALLVGQPMPAWSVDEIRAVHFRMHKAEGVLFRDALATAAEQSGLKLVAIQEKQLATHAEQALGSATVKKLAMLGKSVGPPWGKDQKDAALAALIALRGA